ncbi:hypothetical protein AGMMS49944_00650 [Spirochaetia bacterium]|nr:hypothetical protein AGMMS49944_00650 [Spirochaetia bacterium]
MRKGFCFVVLPILAALVMSCGSSPAVGANGDAQPGWVRRVPADTDTLTYFVGSGREGKTITAKKATARAAALQALNEWKAATVESALRDYVSEYGETGNTQSLEGLENGVKARARANTSGFREVESWVAADEHYEILYSYPINDFRNDFKAATNEFIRNESAAFAEFKADEFFKILDAELDKK